MLRTRTLLLVTAPLLAGLFVAACGDSGTTDDVGNDLGQAGDSATGGSSSSSGGAGNTGGTGTGTGGTSTDDRLAGTENYDCSAPNGTLPLLKLEPIVDGFDRAVLVTHAPGETDRLFVVQQDGQIFVVTKTGEGTSATYAKNAVAFIDLRTPVKSNGEGGGYTDEQGLLGLAFHPDYATNGLFYVHYSAADALPDSNAGDTIVEEYSVSDTDPDVADPASARRVLHVGQPDSNHNGGTISFGPDGMLYIFLGDGGGGNDPHGTIGNGQDVTTLLGKVLRIDPAGDAPDDYSVPSGNLNDTMTTAAPEVWDYGLRNPFRANFDGCTGHLYIGDVGQDAWEEINITPRGEGLKNFGWRITEGLVCRPGGDANCDQTGITMPFAVIETNGTSIVGGTVYRGSEIPSLRGTYLYGTTGSGQVFTMTYDGTDATEAVEVTSDVNPDTDSGRHNITSMQNGGEGEIYVTALASSNLLKLMAE